MTKINTVLGTIDPADLGVTLMHEHLVGYDGVMAKCFPQWFDRKVFVEYACKILARAKRCGVQTIVDQSTIDMDRQIELIKEVSEKAEINIIVSTGIYNNNQGWMPQIRPEYLANLIIGEVEHGIMKTGVRPALFKCASYASGINDNNRKMLKVAAMVHKATGIPIGTHSEAQTGCEQQDILASEGVDLKNVIIGHLGDLFDISYMKRKWRDRGSVVGMDRFGIDAIVPLEFRAHSVAELCRTGYADRMILGHDYIGWADFVDSIPVHGTVF
jgi:phosphotriesterase-related protein